MREGRWSERGRMEKEKGEGEETKKGRGRREKREDVSMKNELKSESLFS